jgi:hypothetical protein
MDRGAADVSVGSLKQECEIAKVVGLLSSPL